MAAAGTPAPPSGVEGTQNIVLGQSGGQANLFGNIPGKSYGIDVTVNLSTKINSILREVDGDPQALVGQRAVAGVRVQLPSGVDG